MDLSGNFLDEESMKMRQEAKDRESRRRVRRAQATALVVASRRKLDKDQHGTIDRDIHDIPPPKNIDPEDWKNALDFLEESDSSRESRRGSKEEPANQTTSNIPNETSGVHSWKSQAEPANSSDKKRLVSESPTEALCDADCGLKSPYAQDNTNLMAHSMSQQASSSDLPHGQKKLDTPAENKTASFLQMLTPKTSATALSGIQSGTDSTSAEERAKLVQTLFPPQESNSRLLDSHEEPLATSDIKKARVLEMLTPKIPSENMDDFDTSFDRGKTKMEDVLMSSEDEINVTCGLPRASGSTFETNEATDENMVPHTSTITAPWDIQEDSENSYTRDKAKLMEMILAAETSDTDKEDVIISQVARSMATNRLLSPRQEMESSQYVDDQAVDLPDDKSYKSLLTYRERSMDNVLPENTERQIFHKPNHSYDSNQIKAKSPESDSNIHNQKESDSSSTGEKMKGANHTSQEKTQQRRGDEKGLTDVTENIEELSIDDLLDLYEASHTDIPTNSSERTLLKQIPSETEDKEETGNGKGVVPDQGREIDTDNEQEFTTAPQAYKNSRQLEKNLASRERQKTRPDDKSVNDGNTRTHTRGRTQTKRGHKASTKNARDEDSSPRYAVVETTRDGSKRSQRHGHHTDVTQTHPKVDQADNGDERPRRHIHDAHVSPRRNTVGRSRGEENGSKRRTHLCPRCPPIEPNHTERTARRRSSGRSRDNEDFLSCTNMERDPCPGNRETPAARRARKWVRNKYRLKENMEDSIQKTERDESHIPKNGRRNRNCKLDGASRDGRIQDTSVTTQPEIDDGMARKRSKKMNPSTVTSTRKSESTESEANGCVKPSKNRPRISLGKLRSGLTSLRHRLAAIFCCTVSTCCHTSRNLQ